MASSTLKRTLLLAALTAGNGIVLTSCASAQENPSEIHLQSPKKNIEVTVMASLNGSMAYSVKVKNQTAVLPSTLGIVVDGQNLGQNASFGKATTRSFSETYPTRGVHPIATNNFQEVVIPVTGGANKTPWQLEVRAFDDGVAYRYRVPEQGAHQIGGETSQWKLPSGSVLWAQKSSNEYERAYEEEQVDKLTAGSKLALMATAKLPAGMGYAMMTEANIINYCDMSVVVGDGNAFNAVFNPSPNGWTNQNDITSPWRVTMLTPDLNGLVNSDIIRNLCPPPAPELANATWIQPARSSWHWMVTGHPRLPEQHQWVDWTKQLGFEYYIIDDGWVDWRADGKDQWACMTDVVDYATTQGVKIIAWVNSREVFSPADREAYFQKANAAGVVGLKIDFPHAPDSTWVQWYDDTLRDAARHHLIVDFHGALKPSGRDRTWPNELTREAIFGRESGKLPATHDTSLPFTRYVQGPADFTPVDWRLDKLGSSSWAHELAQGIIYTSPLLCFSGSPANYLANPAVDVLKAIPSTWDETIVLPDSEIGRTVAFARRKGNDWFIGVINGNEARPFPINLSFLGKGNYRLDKLADSPATGGAWNRTQSTATSKTSFSVDLRRDGGFVAHITPAG